MNKLGLLVAGLCALHGAERKTRNIILITADGLRRQEIFSGIDPQLREAKEAGMAGPAGEELRKQFWAPTAEERRAKLLPFFWKTIAAQGVILGDADRGSAVAVTNRYRVSYPGYSEILTCRAQDDRIRNNDPVQNPRPTVLEFFRDAWRLDSRQVALFASWARFRQIGESRPGAVFINAGQQDAAATPRLAELSRAQHDILPPWNEVRHDYFTFEMALDYLKSARPRVLYVALDETDDWAHDRRYDRVLQMAHYFDRAVERLWRTLQSIDQYRGRTSLILTSDHGRGADPDTWSRHGEKIPGAELIWAAAIGPDTAPQGALANTSTVHQRDIAATMLKLAGLDWQAYCGEYGRPIAPIAGP